jgi:hypothetical protein
MIRRIISGLASLALPVATFAHVGHGAHEGNTIAHYLTSPSHIIPFALVAAFIVVAGIGFGSGGRRERLRLRLRLRFKPPRSASGGLINAAYTAAFKGPGGPFNWG